MLGATNCNFDDCPAKEWIKRLEHDIERNETDINQMQRATRQNENTITKLSGDMHGFMLKVDSKIEELGRMFTDLKKDEEDKQEKEDKFKQDVMIKLQELAPAKWKVNIMWAGYIAAILGLLGFLGWLVKEVYFKAPVIGG